MPWRWDQGRLDYFKFDNIRSIASVLCLLDNVRLRQRGHDPLRVPLTATGLPFLPATYTVWRNYKRVFGAALLASSVNDRLAVTDLCRELARSGPDQMTADDYLSFLVPRFYFPSPVFQGYAHTGPRFFPFCALLRLLVSRLAGGAFGAVTLAEVFSTIIGNECTGEEPIDYYANLQPTGRTPRGDEARQVRELLIFFSQFSFLQWTPDTLFLDIDASDSAVVRDIQALATPLGMRRIQDPSRELRHIGSVGKGMRPTISVPERRAPEDLLFVEGSRVMVNHLRIERSPKLRLMFFESLGETPLCDMCQVYLPDRYPWTENMLEIHHLLPLGSAVQIGHQGTSLSDLVPLCPNCHRGTHVYYRRWLDTREVTDFQSRQQAQGAYEEAKQSYIA